MCEKYVFIGKACWKHETEKTLNMNEQEYLNRVKAIIKHTITVHEYHLCP